MKAILMNQQNKIKISINNGFSFKSLSFVPVDSVGHDVVKIFEGNKTISVQVSSFNHVFNILVSHIFSNVLGYLFEFKAGEFTLILVK